MKTSFLSKLAVIIIALSVFAGCKEKKPKFIVEGQISNADTTMLYLERRTLTDTKIIDSVKLDKDGSFKFTNLSIGYPEFYILRLDKQTINLAIDSTETIKITASKPAFATEYNVEGSEDSKKIKEVVLSQYELSNAIAILKKKYDAKEISANDYLTEIQKAIDNYKEKARAIIFSNYKSMAAYFALFQKVDDYLIFDPYNKKDLTAFQTVATVWDQYWPQSPRTAHLKDFTLAALAEVRNQTKQEETIKKIENTPISEVGGYYDISLPNMQNKEINLSSLKGKVVILDFTAYQTDFSPAHNILINKIYSKHKSDVEVYQVSFDEDQHAWQNTAVNLPWICVRDNKGLNSDLIVKFNIQGLPTTFLVNRKGEIVKRITSADQLAADIQKIL